VRNADGGARSIYRWKALVRESDEIVLLLKTSRNRVAAVRRRLQELHTYELPEDLLLEASSGAKYARWIAESTRIGGYPPA
jgi:periplasmic divalent cation tolerance protein